MSRLSPSSPPNHRALVATAWGGMLAVLLAMLMLEPLRHAMSGDAAGLTTLLQHDPGPTGLSVLVVMLCLNALVQVLVQARTCRTAKNAVLLLSVLYGLFFVAHNVIHFAGGEALGLQSVLDGTHHVLAACAIWGAWQWRAER